jgi:predicted nucleic acid-binding protein
LDRSLELEKRGLMGMDAVHIACAEKAKADFFVTCDDDLIKKLERIDNIKIAFYNVIDFVSREVFKI